MKIPLIQITHEKSSSFMKDFVEEIHRNYHTKSSYEVELDENGIVKSAIRSQIID